MVIYHPSRRPFKLDEQGHARHCWRNKDKLINNVLLWTPSHQSASGGWPARKYLHQLCRDTGFSLEDLLEAMDYRQMVREREICASSMTWWWRILVFFFFFSETVTVKFQNTSRSSAMILICVQGRQRLKKNDQ